MRNNTCNAVLEILINHPNVVNLLIHSGYKFNDNTRYKHDFVSTIFKFGVSTIMYIIASYYILNT